MYSLSKSVPRGYEYLSSRYYRINKHKSNVLQDLPPAVYFHKEKTYCNTSPIRSKIMLVKARKYKSPLSEDEKILKPQQSKFDNLYGNLASLLKKNKNNNKKLMIKCKENFKRMQSLNL